MTLIDHAPLCDKFFDDRLDWTVNNLLGDPDAEMRMQMATVFRILNQHLANASKEERARLDEPLYNKFSEYAAFHEMLSMLRLHRPRATRRNLDEVRNSGKCRAWKFSPSQSARMQMAEQLSADPAIKDKALRLMGVVKSMRTSFENTKASPLPSGTRDQAWIDKDREIRKQMTAFWSGVREYGTISNTAKSLSQKEIQEEIEALSAELSCEHLATIGAEYAKILAGLKAKTAASSTRTKSLVLGDIQTEWGTTDTGKVAPLTTKSKNKTRPDKNDIDGGMSTMSISDQAMSSTTNDETQLEEKVSVKKRTLDIFDMMFPTGDPSQKSVDWPGFVQVMAEVGFVAHHSGGSAVLFEPIEKSKWAGQGKIVIHRPHPDLKIHPVMLLSIGKRMGKWFGWSRECFQLETKPS